MMLCEEIKGAGILFKKYLSAMITSTANPTFALYFYSYVINLLTDSLNKCQ